MALTGNHVAGTGDHVGDHDLIDAALTSLGTAINTKATPAQVDTAIETHRADSTNVHGIVDTAKLVTAGGTDRVAGSAFHIFNNPNDVPVTTAAFDWWAGDVVTP